MIHHLQLRNHIRAAVTLVVMAREVDINKRRVGDLKGQLRG